MVTREFINNMAAIFTRYKHVGKTLIKADTTLVISDVGYSTIPNNREHIEIRGKEQI